MLNVTKDFTGFLKETIREEISKIRFIDIFQITSVDSEQKYSIKRLNTSESYNNVESVGIGLGNGKGLIKLYNENDLVIVCFIMNSNQPYIIGSIYDIFSNEKDTRMSINENEFFVNNKPDGSYIFIDENDNVKIKTPSGAKMKLNADGTFKLFSSDNLGIEIDSSGQLILRGDQIYHTQTAGSWE